MLMASLLGVAFTFYKDKDNRDAILSATYALGIFAAMTFFGIVRLLRNQTEFTPYKVRIVQCNLSQDEKNSNALSAINLQKHVSLSRSDEKIDFIIWPEAAIPYLYSENSTKLHNIISDPLKDGMTLISGAVRKDMATGKVHNSAVFIDHMGRNICNYDKVRLAPFGEYIPFRSLIPTPFQSIASNIGDFDPGNSHKIIEINGLKIVVAICYEAIFSQDFMPKNKETDVIEEADVIINPTNDAWFGFTTQPFQHLQIVRARAIETGLPLIRVTNYGVSAIFDHCGRELNRIPISKFGYVDAFIPKKSKVPTVYSYNNNLLDVWSILLLISIWQ
jgi:apolipoprotein N-acyltransferase